jgi:hypothetical protein
MVVAIGCIVKRKGVSSRVDLLISMKCFVDDTVTSGHQARTVALNYSLVGQKKRSKERKIRKNK